MHASSINGIATIHRGAFGSVEFLRCDGRGAAPAYSEIATHLHFSLPLAGSFVWHAQAEDVFADPTALLCTQAGESYRITHPRGGDSSLVIFPRRRALAQLSEAAERFGLANQRRRLIAPARAQVLAYTMWRDPSTNQDAFAADECLLRFFESLLDIESHSRALREDDLVRRTLEYVHYTPTALLTLSSVAAAMNVRATYLTHVFSRRMGQPLYRYVIALKLTRGLHRIATTDDDLTRIALDLGFNSHSHFSAAFKARYGVSPSEMRTKLGRTTTDYDAAAERSDARTLQWRPLCAARGGTAHS